MQEIEILSAQKRAGYTKRFGGMYAKVRRKDEKKERRQPKRKTGRQH